MEAMGELSSEFRTYHYLTGLVLTELALVLDGKYAALFSVHLLELDCLCECVVF